MKSIAKQLFVVCALCCIGMSAEAQLVIEITKGQANAIPIAVVPFGWTSPNVQPIDVAEVVANDLARCGLFQPLDRRDMIDKPTVGTDIRFQDWKYLKSDYIAVGKIAPEANGYAVQVELFNVLNGQNLFGRRITTSAAGLRSARSSSR